ncbi:hypothetical protein [Gemmatimonas groenlandica]|uniref:Outer membrane protein beta-barrel domain-containing protein n=1 Tax=Gemmatimonas groenlandica TaxID=2732249 RepID=A0A6M4ISH4_9BACT|nr:hypothetical protein [Gemmatimonas groenlandica]QJR36406.1 hypothetical protein HKW67_13275 [Gemmatimonas groenlandica]
MRYIFAIFVAATIAAPTAYAQRTPVFGELGIGFGQTLFSGDIRTRLRQSLGGSFSPGTGGNLSMAFHSAPERWRGLGIGARIKGTFGSSTKGDFGDDYIFNYYNLGLSAKYFPFSRRFNRGLYSRGGIGFGQMTTKRMNESTQSYLHQYAIGSTLSFSTGYTLPLRGKAISVEVEYERSSRNGTINQVGNASFRSGQLGANLVVSF